MSSTGVSASRGEVARSFRVAVPQPLLAHLLEALPQKRKDVKNLLKFGAVRVNGAVVRQFDHPLVAGDQVAIGNLHDAAAANVLEQARVRLIYEDDSLVVVEKPTGLLTVATTNESADTLFVRLNDFLACRQTRNRARAVVVHRIDQDTSGLVVFAKSEDIRHLLQASWQTVVKTYFAVVAGHPSPDQGTISNYLLEDARSLQVHATDYPREGAKIAVTRYRVVKMFAERSLVETQLETGRKHQIRVHMSGLGCPVLGDRRYGNENSAHTRLALHAAGLAIAHPVTGETLELRSPLPTSLRRLVSGTV